MSHVCIRRTKEVSLDIGQYAHRANFHQMQDSEGNSLVPLPPVRFQWLLSRSY